MSHNIYMISGEEVQMTEQSAEALRRKGIDVQDASWILQTSQPFKKYSCEELLDAANHYYSQTLPDLIQAAETLWLASAYAIKSIMLKLRVNIASHAAMREACIFILDNSSVPKKASLHHAWQNAEGLHSFSYGSTMQKEEYDQKKEDAENFVRQMLTVDHHELDRCVTEFVSQPGRLVRCRTEKGKLLLGGMLSALTLLSRSCVIRCAVGYSKLPPRPDEHVPPFKRRLRRLRHGEMKLVEANKFYCKTLELGDGEDPPVTGSFMRRSVDSEGKNDSPVRDPDEPIHIPFNPYSKEPRQCILCKHKVQLDYKNTRLLQQFVSSFSGRVYERHVTGLCNEQHNLLLKTIAMSRKAGYMPILTKDPKFVKDPKLFDPLRPIRQHSFD